MAQRTGIAISPREENDEIRVNALLSSSPLFRNVAVAFEPELEVDGVGRELERRRAERDDASCGSEPAVPPLFFRSSPPLGSNSVAKAGVRSGVRGLSANATRGMRHVFKISVVLSIW